MIDRYTRPKMKAIWELKRKYEIWLEVELAACAAFERVGQVPRGTSARIGKKATIDVKRIARIEKVTKHDVIAFLESLVDSVGGDVSGARNGTGHQPGARRIGTAAGG